MMTSPGVIVGGRLVVSLACTRQQKSWQLLKIQRCDYQRAPPEVETASWFNSFGAFEFDDAQVITVEGIHPGELGVHPQALGVNRRSRSKPPCM